MRKWKKHSDYFSQNDVNALRSVTTQIFSERLRNGLILRITAFENYVAPIAGWGKITWQLCCNGIPVSPFDNQKSQIGQQGIPQEVIVDYDFPPASVLSANAINSDGGADYNVGIVLKGEYGTYE